MRVALLSSLEGAAGEPQALRGGLLVGGRSVLRHQLALALAFGCQRIVTLAETLTGELVALQQIAEERGARFHVVASTRAIVPLVAPEDELLVLSDGLLAMPADALRLLEEGPAILTLPVETGLAAGFERIDINHAAAGAMRLPGRIVAGLGELPSEWNPVSALLRLAVQARVTMRAVPGALLDEGRWRLLRNEAEAQTAEPAWLRLHIASDDDGAPSGWLATIAVRLTGSAILHAGTRPWVLMLAALVAVLLGLGAGWFGWIGLGLLLAGVATVAARVSALLARIERNALLARAGRFALDGAFGWIQDAAIVTLCAWRSDIPKAPGIPWGLAWFAPLVLMLGLRLLGWVVPPGRVAAWLGDRLAVGAALAFLSATVSFDLGVRVVVVMLMAAGLAAARKARIGHSLDGPQDGQGPNHALTSRA
ncbi:hypothetical protein OLX02_02470 [Novosphingobium sp. KCTC 2891]|uniref:hypothetical protein n=1 Tax=Novosphingobium sp. KCTC 2891 TaxID=2989730 RepID=UPI0022218BA7|nr:hypothetical protein [Novosphingobium sp. KCTC 2891]MCW1381680.1 hypothetical protein [Novosphingobium sp. KCTC 2891]